MRFKITARKTTGKLRYGFLDNRTTASYEVDKFWRIIAVEADRKIVVCTRRGKQLELIAEDPALRRLSWWERLLYWRRLPEIASPD
jgi:hypothetical protein